MMVVIGTLAIVGVTIVIGVFVDRRFALLPRREALEAAKRPALPGHLAGEAPSTAIRARDAQLARLRAGQRCPSCRSEMTGLRDDIVRYDNRDLYLLRFECPRCRIERSLYVQPVE